jgi:hypothetical protein
MFAVLRLQQRRKSRSRTTKHRPQQLRASLVMHRAYLLVMQTGEFLFPQVAEIPVLKKKMIYFRRLGYNICT